MIRESKKLRYEFPHYLQLLLDRVVGLQNIEHNPFQKVQFPDKIYPLSLYKAADI